MILEFKMRSQTLYPHRKPALQRPRIYIHDHITTLGLPNHTTVGRTAPSIRHTKPKPGHANFMACVFSNFYCITCRSDVFFERCLTRRKRTHYEDVTRVHVRFLGEVILKLCTAQELQFILTARELDRLTVRPLRYTLFRI